MNSFLSILLFLLSYSQALAILFIGIILYRQHKSRLIFFLLFTISLFTYLLFYSLIYMTKKVEWVQIFYRLSSIGWLTTPLTALFFILSLLDEREKWRTTNRFLLMLAPLAPLWIWIFSGRFLATDFSWNHGVWIELVNPHPLLVIWYCMVIIFYLVIGFISILRQKRRFHNKKKDLLMNLLFYPLTSGAVVIIIASIIIPILFPGRIPSITHIFIGLIYLYSAILVYFNKVDILQTDSILKSVFKQDSLVIYYLTREGRISQVIYQSPDFLNWSDRDLINSPLKDFFADDMSDRGFYEQWLSKTIVRAEGEIIDKLGKSCPVKINMEKQFSRFNDLQGYLFIARDNRQMKNLKEDLKRLSGSNVKLRDRSIKDPLTGIYNRAKFLSSVEREELQVKRYSARTSIIMFDIDHFKVVNDTHGHDVGDMVLTSVVDNVIGHLRDEDIIARWGGEEFIILSRNTELHQAAALAERLRAGLEDMKLETVGRITASFGVSQFHPDEGYEQLLKRVDVNLYKAKEQGRNRVITDPDNSGLE